VGQEAAMRPLGPAGPSLAPISGKAHISASLARLLALTVIGYAVIRAFTTWAPVHVPGYARLAAQTTVILASILLAIDIPATPFWGHLSDRIGRRKPFLIYAFVIYAAGALPRPAPVPESGPQEDLSGAVPDGRGRTARWAGGGVAASPWDDTGLSDASATSLHVGHVGGSVMRAVPIVIGASDGGYSQCRVVKARVRLSSVGLGVSLTEVARRSGS
jgi:hypothetical protein